MSTSSPSQHNEVAVRDAMLGAASMAEALTALRELNVSAFELALTPDGRLLYLSDNGQDDFNMADASSITRCKTQLDEAGIRVCAVLLGTDFCGPNAAGHITWAVSAVRAAKALGAGVVRIDPLTSNRELSMPQIRDNFVRGINQVLEQTADTGVDLGIENHGAVGNDPAFLDGIFERIDDARLGMTLDTGNFYWSGVPLQELYGIFEHFAPRAKHTHIKSIAYPAEMREIRRATGYEYGRYCAPIDQGDIDISRVLRILREAGYRNSLCIENEALGRFPAEERLKVLRSEAELLRALQT
jgi:sugar phosphate isomerase/epimerase